MHNEGQWQPVQLGEVLEFLRNGTSSNQCTAQTAYPVTRIETISEGKIDFSRTGYLHLPEESYRMAPGDILYSHINSVAHIGKVAIFLGGKTLYHGMNLMLLRPTKEKIYPKYLFSILSSEIGRRYARRECKPAVNQASLTQSDICKFSFLIPELPEQSRIAYVLDTIDEAIVRTEAVISKLKQVRAGMLHDLLRYGLDEHGQFRDPIAHPEQFKESPLGLIPKEWAVKPLNDILDLRRGLAFSSSHYVNSGILNYRVTNIGYNLQSLGDTTFLPKRFFADFPNQQLFGGEIVIVMVGATTGKLGRVPKDCCPALMNQNMWNIVPKQKVDREYLWHLLPNAVHRHMSMSQGSARDFLKQTEFVKTIVAGPFENGFDEQERIVSKLDSLERNILIDEAELSKLKSLKSGLQNDLLTGRVRAPETIMKGAENA